MAVLQDVNLGSLVDSATSCLLVETFESGHDSLDGRYFYDAGEQAWFEIVQSSFVFVSFTYAFGVRWANKHHKIDKVKRCSKKQANYIMTCSRHEYDNLHA